MCVVASPPRLFYNHDVTLPEFVIPLPGAPVVGLGESKNNDVSTLFPVEAFTANAVYDAFGGLLEVIGTG